MRGLRSGTCLRALATMLLLAVPAAGQQEQSSEFTWSELHKKLGNQTDLEEYERRLTDSGSWPLSKVLAELTAIESPAAADLVFRFVETVLKKDVLTQDEFDGLTSALTHLGDRYRVIGTDERIVPLLRGVAAGEFDLPKQVRDAPGDPQRKLVAAAIYGLAHANLRQQVQGFAEQHPALVKTALETLNKESPSQSPATSPPSGSGFTDWVLYPKSARYEAKWMIGKRPVLTAVHKPAGEHADEVWFWDGSIGNWAWIYNLKTGQWLDYPSKGAVDHRPAISLAGAGTDSGDVPIPELPPLPDRQDSREEP